MRISSLLLLAGCASSSISGDLDRVRELTRAVELAAVADVEVDPTTSKDVQALLAEPLDAEGAVRIALLNNRELRAELRAIGIARGDLVEAGLIPNPVFEAEALPERDTQVELRLEYDLTSLLLTAARSAEAEAELEARRQRAAGLVLELGYRVRTAFFDLLAAEQRLGIAQRALDAFAAARDAATALLDAGNIPPIEALTPIAAYERARVTVAELELERAAAREAVHRLLSVSGPETEWRASGALASVPEQLALPESLERKAVVASLELSEARSRLEAIAHRTSATRTEGWVPGLEIDVHSLYGHPEDEGEAHGPPWRFGAGVSLALPLFDRNQGTLLRHESEFDAESERLEALAIDLRSAVREARSRVISSHARALQYQTKILPAQRRVVDYTLLQYNAMQLGIFQLLEAHRAALQLELEFVATLSEYWNAQAALQTLLAGRMVGSDAPRAEAMPQAGPAGGH